jgi:hypothetical protein
MLRQRKPQTKTSVLLFKTSKNTFFSLFSQLLKLLNFDVEAGCKVTTTNSLKSTIPTRKIKLFFADEKPSTSQLKRAAKLQPQTLSSQPFQPEKSNFFSLTKNRRPLN